MQNKAFRIWTNFNKSARILLIFLGILLAGSFYRGCASDSAADRWRTQYEEFRDRAEAVSTIADSLQGVADSALASANAADALAQEKINQIEQQQKEISDLQGRIDISETQNDAVFTELTHEQDVETVVDEFPPAAEVWIRFSFNLREENILLKRQIEAFKVQIIGFRDLDLTRQAESSDLRTALANQTARADSLQLVILSIPPAPPKEKFLGIIPLPSRKTSLYIGAGLGVLAHIALNNFLAGGN